MMRDASTIGTVGCFEKIVFIATALPSWRDILTPMNHGPKILLLAITVSAFGLSQAQPSSAKDDSVLSTWRTAQMWNGRFWRTLTESQKNMFLFGYSNGVDTMSMLAAGRDFEKYKSIQKTFWARNLTVEEVRTSLDRIYDTPENGPIGIPNAIYVISMRSEGADEESIQKEIAELRAREAK